MCAGFFGVEDLGCAGTCLWVRSCSEQFGGYRFLFVVVWNSDSWFGRMNEDWCKIKQINHLKVKAQQLLEESSFPPSQIGFCWFSCLRQPLLPFVLDEMVEPLSWAQRIMGKVRQVSSVSPLWLIPSITYNDLLFKGGWREIKVRYVCWHWHWHWP